MAVREKRNAIKIEGWRVSRVPIDPTETILQGDMMAWVDATKRATKLTAAASGAQFCGVSDTSNPVETAGTLTSDTAESRINLVQQGLVEMIAGEIMTVFPFDLLTVGADSQTVIKTGASAANKVGVGDTAYGAGGKTFAVGDLVKMWITVKDLYRVFV